MAALLAHPTDVDAIGPELAQGLYLTGSFYWDLNDGTRAFTRKVLDRMPQKHPPNMIQAGCYAGTLHYLKAVAALGAAKAKADGAAVVAQMKAMPTYDTVFGPGKIREDGRALFPPTCSRPRRRRTSSRNGTCSSWSRPRPRTRPGARSARAAAR